MKKLSSLFVLFLILVGCNKEKEYREDLKGTWQVYKYILHNSDKTPLYNGYSVSFTDEGHYVELYETVTDTSITSGTYYFTNDAQKIVLADSVYNLVDTVLVASFRERRYQLYNLTSNHVQLRTDSSELYMNKKL